MVVIFAEGQTALRAGIPWRSVPRRANETLREKRPTLRARGLGAIRGVPGAEDSPSRDTPPLPRLADSPQTPASRCKLAVEAHGGEIRVDSEVGHGCTFWFTLPEAQVREPT